MESVELKGHVGPHRRFMGTYTRRPQEVNMSPSYVMTTNGAKYFMYQTPVSYLGSSIRDSLRERWFVSTVEPPALTTIENHQPFISTKDKSKSPAGGLGFKIKPP